LPKAQHTLAKPEKPLTTSDLLNKLDPAIHPAAKKKDAGRAAGDEDGAQLIHRQNAPAIMHTPARPPLLDARRDTRRSVAAEIEPVRAQALLLESRKEFVEAARCWQTFLEQHPEHAEAANELGSVFVRMERFEDGLRWFARALEIRPDLAAAKINVGIALRELKRFEEAAARFREMLASTPDDAIACLNLGLSLRALQRHDEALGWLRKASNLRPGDAESARQLADVLTVLKRNKEAITAYEHAVALQPDNIPVLLSFGERLQEGRRFEEAAAVSGKVVDLDPSHCNGWLSLGAALLGLHRYADSLAAFRRGLALEPGSAVAYCNMSLALMGLDRVQEAIEASRKALSIEAGSPVASFNLGCALLALGNFREGWARYDYRFVMGGNKWLRPEAKAAPWTGETLAGKSILVLGEQGNGDQIQFSRYLPALSDLGASVHYLAPERLHRLFRTLRGSITLLSEIPPDARFDFQCPLMSLPGRFDRLDQPVPTQPYLKAESERIARWKELISDQGFHVGVAWRGNRYPHGDGLRSFRLDALRPLAALPGVRLISLQLKEGKEELDKLPAEMHVELPGPDFDAGPDGFLDSAAILALMDLVISCDTSIAHLAGALGRPLWIALNHSPEWRWQRQGTDTIWYPTARLFRQETNGDWDRVFSQMTEELVQLLRARAGTQERASASRKTVPCVEMSWGDLLERIAILEIKAKRPASEAAVVNVTRELDHLKSVVATFEPFSRLVEAKWDVLRTTNEKLWDIENAMRACEAEQRFEAPFTQLAREAQSLNDERTRLKREIDSMIS
jgi:tetratricopeptide (TPR) repeat protein